MFLFVHSDGPGYLQRAAGRRGSVRFAVWRERAQRCCGRGSLLVSKSHHIQTKSLFQTSLTLHRAARFLLREKAKSCFRIDRPVTFLTNLISASH